jgi:predicted DNA-binding transcriptional regulator AlpA
MDKMLTLKDVSGQILVCPKTLMNMVKKRKFPQPALKIGRSPRWRAEDVEAFLADRARQAQEVASA